MCKHNYRLMFRGYTKDYFYQCKICGKTRVSSKKLEEIV